MGDNVRQSTKPLMLDGSRGSAAPPVSDGPSAPVHRPAPLKIISLGPFSVTGETGISPAELNQDKGGSRGTADQHGQRVGADVPAA